MEYANVSKIVEVNSAESADRYIATGWKLLVVYTTTYDTIGPLIAHQTPHFVLGWLPENGEPEFPTAEKQWNLEATKL